MSCLCQSSSKRAVPTKRILSKRAEYRPRLPWTVLTGRSFKNLHDGNMKVAGWGGWYYREKLDDEIRRKGTRKDESREERETGRKREEEREGNDWSRERLQKRPEANWCVPVVWRARQNLVAEGKLSKRSGRMSTSTAVNWFTRPLLRISCPADLLSRNGHLLHKNYNRPSDPLKFLATGLFNRMVRRDQAKFIILSRRYKSSFSSLSSIFSFFFSFFLCFKHASHRDSMIDEKDNVLGKKKKSLLFKTWHTIFYGILWNFEG